MRKKWLALILSTSILASSALVVPQKNIANAITTSTAQVVFYLEKQEAYRNGDLVMLDSPATAVSGKTYLPAKFLGDTFGMAVTYDAATRTVKMVTEDHVIILDTNNDIVTVDGVKQPNNNIARMINGRIMVQLTWLCDYMGATYTYVNETKKVTVTYVPKAVDNYDKDLGSIPVAKFSVDKASYDIGETITYTNLSYDPDSESVSLTWTNKKDAFFEAGTYEVSLVAIDKSGNKSKPYTKQIVINDHVLFSEFEYGVYAGKAGSYIKATDNLFNSQILQITQPIKSVSFDTTRKLLVSDSPENIRSSGVLYQDNINGKARLYANHVNKTGKNMDFAILATNNGSEPVTLKTTNVGEVYPSKYAMLLGSESNIDFLMYNPIKEEFTIKPGETIIYRQFPKFYPEYGINTMYDIESSGNLLITFATDERASEQMVNLNKLAFDGHVRGTFEASDIYWNLDLTKVGKDKLQRLVIGDGKADPFINGYDVQRDVATSVTGNYGAVYHITVDNPGNMAVLLMARGGSFKGAFKVNGQFVRVPTSGVLTPFDGLVSLGKTTSKDKKLTIEFSPPAGSSFPINLIFYPLDSRVEQIK